MKADGIRDEGTLKEWVEGQTSPATSAMLSRAALRVFPFAWLSPAEVSDKTIYLTAMLPHVVCAAWLKRGPLDLLTARIPSEVYETRLRHGSPSLVSPLAEVRRTNAASFVGRGLHSNKILDALDASISVADSLTRKLTAPASPHGSLWIPMQLVASLGELNELEKEDSKAQLLSELRADAALIEAGSDPLTAPLWHGDPPDWFRDADAGMRAIWGRDPATWGFWLRWWDGVLSGDQIDWDLQEAVALLPNEIWQAGPDTVAEEIARIELDFAVAASPNAEDIIVNTEGKYEAVPRSELPARTLRDARDRIVDTIRLIRNGDGQNQHAALVPEAELLEDALQKYGDNPLRLYEVCAKVVRHVGLNVAQGVLPENDNVVADVRGDLQDTADDIYGFDSEVRQTVDARRKMRFARLDETQKTRIAELAGAVADYSVPLLAAELREDAAVVRGEAQPTEDTAANRARLGSRLARVIVKGGEVFRNVTDALRLVGGVAGGIREMVLLICLLLGQLF